MIRKLSESQLASRCDKTTYITSISIHNITLRLTWLVWELVWSFTHDERMVGSHLIKCNNVVESREDTHRPVHDWRVEKKSSHDRPPVAR